MYMTGFADEAAKGLDGQIKATLELGWCHMESRAVDGVNLTNVTDAAFDEIEAKLNDAGVTVNCFGSAIANWGKQINEPFDSSLEESKRAIPRMHRLGCKLIRIMSFAVLKDRGPHDQMKEERFERLRTLVDLFEVEGLLPVHENCMNYGGMSASHTLELIENVPGLKLVFDTGNPVFTDDRSKPEPYPKQSAWEFYEAVRNHVAYMHIKDGIWDADTGTCEHTYCGEGQGDVIRIMTDLIRTGYDGGISIEPHLGAIFHDPSVTTADDKRYAMYVEYGKRMEAIIRNAGGSLD
jgi:sugar phosphate isomerase/epimerase